MALSKTLPAGIAVTGGHHTGARARALEMMLWAMKDFAYIFDRDGRIVYANQSLLDLWGIDLDQAMGKDFAALNYPADLAARLQRQIQEVIDTRRVLVDETPYTSPKGQTGHYEYIFSPVITEDGFVESVIGTTRDITVRKALAEERERLVAALRNERSRLAAIIEQAPAFICTLRGPEHVFELVNARYYELVGKRDLIGKPVRRALPEIEGQGFTELLDSVYDTGKAFIGSEMPVLLKGQHDDSPHRRYLNFLYQAMHETDGSVSGIFVHGVDVTDVVRSREALSEGEAYLRAALDSSAGGFYGVDHDGVTTICNAAFVRMLGFQRPEEAVGKTLHGVIHHSYPDGTHYPKEMCPIYRAARTGQSAHVVDELFFRLDGSSFPVEYWTLPIVRDGEFRGAVTTFIDITERKRAEQAIRHAAAEALATAEANAKFRTFFDQGSYFAGVMAVDGTVLEANRLCMEACGFTRADIIGRKFWDCGWWNPSPALMEMIRQGTLEAAAGNLFRIETAYFVADGSERFAEITLAPVTDDTGRVLFVAPTGVDITEKKRLADERERLLEAERFARAEAERTSRIKDEFLATLSHELRTPLNAILGWSQILAGGGSRNEDDLAEGLRTIERNARAQTQIIEDLLDMSRIISGKVKLDVQSLELAAVVQAAVETTRHAADAKGVRVQPVFDPAAGPVMGDPNRLQQVFWNLLTNAIKFTPRGGRVVVRLERVHAYLQVSITDTGEGIAPEFLSHVFDRFRQADASTTRRHGGLGLGLSIVKQLVELHGGLVKVTSDGLGTGSTFVVSIPLAGIHAEPEPEASDQQRPSALAFMPFSDLSAKIAGVRVLVVDDEPDARALVKRLLEECGALVEMAATASEAAKLVQSGAFDVLVSDIGMPGEDGYSLIKRIRALGKSNGGDIPAIALTAYARAEDRVKAVAAGFLMHVAKPVEPIELITMVAGAAGRTGR